MRKMWLFLAAVILTICVNSSQAGTQEQDDAWMALVDVEWHMFSLEDTEELTYFASLCEDFYTLTIDLWQAVDLGMDPETADLVSTYVIDAGNSLTDSATALGDFQSSLIEATENGYDVAVKEYFDDNFQQSLAASQYAETELTNNADLHWQTFVQGNLDAQMLMDEANMIIMDWYSGGGGAP